VGRPFLLVVADTASRAPTREVVGDLRRPAGRSGPLRAAFRPGGRGSAAKARAAIERGQAEALGPLLDENHALLQAMGVSCPELDRLVIAAPERVGVGRQAVGCRLGGNMIALVTDETRAGWTWLSGWPARYA